MALRALQDFLDRRDSLAGLHACDRALTDHLLSTDHPVLLKGWCAACGGASEFVLAEPERFESFRNAPNWRETLTCRGCGLINRLRASIELFRTQANNSPGGGIYLTERVTPLFAWLDRHYADVRGSEFFGDDKQPGELCSIEELSVAHEDVTRLSLGSGSIRHVLSFDVLEHVPDYRQALAQFHRVLCTSGTILLSIPFDLEAAATLRRASLRPDGSIEHHEPAEFHGDPVNRDAGVLCFYRFGWDLLDEMRAVGFRQVRVRMYWNPANAYLGWPGILITGRKA
jgi:hypothetical protein